MKILDFLIEPFVKLWEVEDEIPEKIDVIVGIGTGLKKDGTCSPQSWANTEKTAVFWKERIAKSNKIIFTSGNSWEGPREAEAMADLAVEFGVPKEDIIVEADSKNTRENAIETQAIVVKESGTENPWKNILVVAYRIHARKVRDCFKKVFEDPHLKNSFKIYITKTRADHDSKIPQKRLRSKARFFFWELLSYALFKFKGWV